MAIILYGMTILINVFIGKFHQRNAIVKSNPIIMIFSFISTFILMSGYRNTSGLSNDLFNSELEYSNIINGIHSNYEIGYIFFMKVGGLFTPDFYLFRNVVIGIFLFILFCVIQKWAPSPHYVIALFNSYLIILSSEQLRYFMAFVMFVIGLFILVYSKYKHKKIIFSFFLILASTLHLSFVIYFLFLLSNNSLKSNREKIITGVTLVFCIIIFLNNNHIPGLSQMLKLVDNYKILVYMSQSTNLGFLYPFVLQLSSILLVFWALKLFRESNTNEDTSIIEHVYKLNLLVVLFFPLFMLQLTFYRLARNILIINYLVYSQIRNSKDINQKNKRFFAFIVWNSVIVWIIFDLIIKTPAQALLIPFFTDNVYFNFL